MDTQFEGETASSRLKQVGLMTILYEMHNGRVPLTTANITEYTGLTRGGFDDAVELLIKRGLLEETVSLNAIGRGRSRMFHIPESIFDRLKHFESV